MRMTITGAQDLDQKKVYIIELVNEEGVQILTTDSPDKIKELFDEIKKDM